MYKIIEVNSAKELKKFIDFPHELYKNDPNYVPALYTAEKDLLTTHPFHEHSELQAFLAIDSEENIVGRIAAINNKNHFVFNNAKDGFWGFFESINELEVAKTLFASVENWLKERGLCNMIGPVNPSTNESCGLLVDGFDSPPVVMMTYNPPYYVDLLAKVGLVKYTDLIAYDLRTKEANLRSMNLLESLKFRLERNGITFRNLDIKNIGKEIDTLIDVYNGAWDKNLGFVPMTGNEFKHMGKDMKLIADPDFCLVAEHKGTPIAFALAIPDINQIQKNIKKGRLFPFGVFKLLFGRKKINRLRVLALGVLEDHRKQGIEAVLYGHIIKKAIEKNIVGAEASWILEGNTMMNKAILDINGEPYKTYRLLVKDI